MKVTFYNAHNFWETVDYLKEHGSPRYLEPLTLAPGVIKKCKPLFKKIEVKK